MRYFYIFIAIISGTHLSPAQSPTATIDINNVRVTFNAVGDIVQFEAPKNSGLSPLYAANLWIAGMDAQSQLHLAAQTYSQGGSDFFAGPLDTVTAMCTAAMSAQWNKVWKINKTMIDSFILGLYGTAVPPEVSAWPAHGNPVFNQSKKLAPFMDVNNDGNYTPATGDYPLIQGDQALYFIFNDAMQGTPHGTGGLPLGVEVHGMAYAFRCGNDSALNNTIFVSYRIINRSPSPYQSWSSVGVWADHDMGYYGDDYLGFDVERDCFYAYNGDGYDDYAYLSNLAAQAVVLLRGPLSDSADGIDNDRDCIVDETDSTGGPMEPVKFARFMSYYNNFGPLGNPVSDTDYYSYMGGIWKDGTPVTYGGNGHNTGIPCSFMFPDLSDQLVSWGTGGNCQSPQPPQPQWNEVTAGSTPFDRRGIASCKYELSFLPNKDKHMTLAYVFGRDYTGSGTQASLNVMNTRVDSICSYFNANLTPCGMAFNTAVAEEPASESVTVYPNPAFESIYLDFDMSSAECLVQVFDMTGRLVCEIVMEKVNTRIEVDQLPQGLYAIWIADGDRVFSVKFLKQ